jgi:hypothetical protein
MKKRKTLVVSFYIVVMEPKCQSSIKISPKLGYKQDMNAKEFKYLFIFLAYLLEPGIKF